MFIFCSAIPKNGGHTLIEFLKQFNLKMILVEGSPYHHSLKYKDYKPLPNLNSNEIILGHIPYASFKKNYINNIDADFMTITSIREPIERTISELAFNNNHDDLQIYEYKVKNWAGDAIDNLQTRMLSDDPNFFEKINSSHLKQAKKNMQAIDLIIDTNNFIKLFDHFQIDQNIRLNIVDSDRKNLISKNTDLLKLIRENNQYDLELYNYFCTKFKNFKINNIADILKNLKI